MMRVPVPRAATRPCRTAMAAEAGARAGAVPALALGLVLWALLPSTGLASPGLDTWHLGNSSVGLVQRGHPEHAFHQLQAYAFQRHPYFTGHRILQQGMSIRGRAKQSSHLRLPGASASCSLTPPKNRTSRFSPYFRYGSMNVSVSASGALQWSPFGAYDWRSIAGLPPVDDQGNCSSAWAMATVVALEVAWNQSRNVQTPNLSVQEILDCTCVYCNATCVLDAYDYLACRTGSLYSGGDLVADMYPYLSFSGPNSKTCQKLIIGEATFGLTMFESAPPCALDFILALQKTPVTLSLQGDAASFVNYPGGFVYSDPQCFTNIPNHAVLAVGYNLTAPVPYFVIRNSWGSSWGNKGYMDIAIAPGFGTCGMFYLPGYYPIIPPVEPCSRGECGSGTCQRVNSTVAASNRTNICTSCPQQYTAVTNLDFSQSCVTSNTCQSGGINPCGVGSCSNSGAQKYSCSCPTGYRTASLIDGQPTCRPDLGAAKGSFCTAFFSVTMEKETCASVAAKFGLTLAALRSLNSGLTCPTAGLTPGQSVCIEKANSSAPQSELWCTQYASVGAADTCQSIVAAQGDASFTLLDLHRLNPGLDCSGLQPKTSVGKLPSCLVCGLCVAGVPSFACPVGANFSVKAGDSCGAIIEQQFQKQRSLLGKANANLSCCTDKLTVGEGLCSNDGGACAGGTNPCGVGTCQVNSDGSVSCACPPGYVGKEHTDGTYFCGPDSAVLPGSYCITFFTVTQKRETCADVAKIFSVDVEYIQTLNPKVACSDQGLSPGLVLCVEESNSNSRMRDQLCTEYYKLKQGDTCQSVAAKYNLTFLELYRFNPGLNCNNLSLPCGLCVKKVSQQPCPRDNVTLSLGDTCSSLVGKYFNGSSTQLALANQGFQCCDKNLFVGEQLCRYHANACQATALNPCGVGTCINTGPGTYACVCPLGYKPTLKASGQPTCVIDENAAPGLYCTTFFTVTQNRETCAYIASLFQITVAALVNVNSRTGNSGLTLSLCRTGLPPGLSVCVEAESGAGRERLCTDYFPTSPNATCGRIEAVQPEPFTILDLYRLNPGLNCNNLTLPCGLCVADVVLPPCGRGGSYLVSVGDTCASIIRDQYSGNSTRLVEANLGFECCDANLYQGERLCLWRADACQATALNPCGVGTCINTGLGTYACVCPLGYKPTLKTTGQPTCVIDESAPRGLYCTTFFTVTQNRESCAFIASLFGITVQALMSINAQAGNTRITNALCRSGLPPGLSVCVEAENGGGRERLCTDYYPTSPDTTCKLVEAAQPEPFTILDLYRLNPGLNCNNLTLPCGLCVEDVALPPCGSNGQYLVDVGDTCASIIREQYSGVPKHLKQANLGFECCDAALYDGERLCLWKNPTACQPFLGAPNPCGNGTCVNVVGYTGGFTEYKCRCSVGYRVWWDGRRKQRCVPANPCSSQSLNPCGVGTCSDNLDGSYACDCLAGYKLGQDTSGLPLCVPDSAAAPGIYCTAFFTVTELRETCRQISALFRLSIPTLVDLNPKLDCTKPNLGLTEGFSVCLEVSSSAQRSLGLLCQERAALTPDSTCQEVVAAQPDPFTLLDLYRFNPGLNCNNLTLPCGLCTRGVPPLPCGARGSYKVALGDTCQSITQARFNGSRQRLTQANQRWKCCDSELYLGEKICLWIQPTACDTFDGSPNPCGAGTCVPLTGGGYRCRCPEGYTSTVALPSNRATCTPNKVCLSGGRNPCGVGTCKDLGPGEYECVCPLGYRLAQKPTGDPVCVADGLVDPGLYCSTFFTVSQARETCGMVASLVGIEVAALKELNPGLTCGYNGLRAARSLCVKGFSAEAVPRLPLCTRYSPVSPQATCSSVAASQPRPFSLMDLYRLNPGLLCRNIQELPCGLCTKAAAAPSTCSNGSFAVQPGSTCLKITGWWFGGKDARLGEANGDLACCDEDLFVGERLCRPAVPSSCAQYTGEANPCQVGTCQPVDSTRYKCTCPKGYTQVKRQNGNPICSKGTESDEWS